MTTIMPLDRTDTYFENDLDVLLRLQGILLEAVEGARGAELNHEYGIVRRMLLADATYKDMVPTFVRRHRDLDSLWPALKSFSPQWEPRRVEVRRQFEPCLELAERAELFGNNDTSPQSYDSKAWTGASTPSDRIIAVKTLIPIALHAVDNLIASLETPSHNGGPPLDGTQEAIENLRALHRALSELLEAADEGKLGEPLTNGFAAEAARYAKRAAKALRDDPIPYAFSGTILAVMSACGLPGIGGYLAGVAVNMKRK
jgi:hypothetical protein